MADIELVIKIPKAYYELVLERCKDPVLLNAFKSGTPLPKGHGNLKDFDKIEWYGCDFEDGKTCIKNRGNCDICTFANCDANQVRKLPTIIKADKGDKDGNND